MNSCIFSLFSFYIYIALNLYDRSKNSSFFVLLLLCCWCWFLSLYYTLFNFYYILIHRQTLLSLTFHLISSHLYFPSYSSCCFVVYYNCYNTTICWVLSLLTRSTLLYPLLFSFPFLSPKKVESNLLEDCLWFIFFSNWKSFLKSINCWKHSHCYS